MKLNPHPLITHIEPATQDTDAEIETIYPDYTIQITPYMAERFHCQFWSESGQSLHTFYSCNDLTEALESILKRVTKTN